MDYDLQSAVNSHILTLSCIVLQRIDWVMILSEINKVALQCKNKLPFPALQRSCSNSIKVTWTVQLRSKAVFITSLSSNFLRFPLLAVIFRTTLN